MQKKEPHACDPLFCEVFRLRVNGQRESMADYSALMTALWTAFQPAAVIPQLLVEFLLTLILTLRLFTFLLALIPMTVCFIYCLTSWFVVCNGRLRVAKRLCKITNLFWHTQLFCLWGDVFLQKCRYSENISYLCILNFIRFMAACVTKLIK